MLRSQTPEKVAGQNKNLKKLFFSTFFHLNKPNGAKDIQSASKTFSNVSAFPQQVFNAGCKPMEKKTNSCVHHIHQCQRANWAKWDSGLQPTRSSQRSIAPVGKQRKVATPTPVAITVTLDLMGGYCSERPPLGILGCVKEVKSGQSGIWAPTR